MKYSVERSREAEADVDAHFDFLIASYVELGDSMESAFERASARMQRLKAELRMLAKAPHQGTLRPQLGGAVRNVTKDRAIFYFTVDDERRVVRVLAVFFGGQDHQRAMLRRAMGGEV